MLKQHCIDCHFLMIRGSEFIYDDPYPEDKNAKVYGHR